MAHSLPMAVAMAVAAAMAVIRPEHAEGGRIHENDLLSKTRFTSILFILGPSRPHKWIRLEILHQKIVSGCLETKN